MMAKAKFATREHEVLSIRIRDLSEAGQGVPCYGSSLPISEDEDERKEAAETLCPECPVIAECFAAGRSERWGVWGGADRSPVKPKPTTTAATATTTEEAH